MEKLDINKVINQDLIVVGMNEESKEGALKVLINRLYEQGYLSDKAEFLKDVLERESEGLTGLGKGIAIPHGKSDGVVKTTIAIGRNNRGIEWESLDDEPVDLIILFAVKKTDETTTHIKMLQKVAILLADDEFLKTLKLAEKPVDIYELLTK